MQLPDCTRPLIAPTVKQDFSSFCGLVPHMHQWNGSSLAHIMTSPDLMMIYYLVALWEQTTMKFYWNLNQNTEVFIKRRIWKYCLQTRIHFASASICQLHDRGMWYFSFYHQLMDCFSMMMSSYQHRKSYFGGKMILWSSYLYCSHNGVSYTGKTESYIETIPWLCCGVLVVM